MPLGTERAIIRAIADLQTLNTGPITNEMIGSHCGYSVRTVKRTIRRLLMMGLIDREQMTVPGVPGYRYRYEVFCHV